MGLTGNGSGMVRGVSATANGGSEFPTIEEYVGRTPLVRLQRLRRGSSSNLILAKLEGNNPAGSVKDRPALSMIQEAELRGDIKPGDTLIEATSGNTGIALAMAAAIKGYQLKLIMPSNMSEERKASMAAYGAELISVPSGQMEYARDLAKRMELNGEGRVLDQFGNDDNPLAHYRNTGPEIWEQTSGRITHFVSSMGTTGTVMGTSRFLKEKNPDIKIVGLQPTEEASIPGIRRWPKEYLPRIFDKVRVDEVMEISQEEAETHARLLAKEEGIFSGISSGGAVSAALRLSEREENAVIVCIICDRGDRYLSTGLFNEKKAPAMAPECDPTNLRETVSAKLASNVEKLVVVFSADDDPETGKPWCPDCALAVPIIKAYCKQFQIPLIKCNVGDRPTWKDPNHTLRQDSQLKLTGVPTVTLWDSNGPSISLGPELEECKTADDVEALIVPFLDEKCDLVIKTRPDASKWKPFECEFTAVGDALSEFKSNHNAFWLYCVASNDSTGNSWCPDCRLSTPIIAEYAQANSIPLLRCALGDRDTWKSPSHPLRNDPSLKLVGAPTLIAFNGGVEHSRLGPELEQCETPREVASLLSTFLENSWLKNGLVNGS